MRNDMKWVLFGCALMGLSSAASAGPPFDVDDPGTAEHRHFVFTGAFLANQGRTGESQNGSLEVDYGLRPDVELDLALNQLSQRAAGNGRINGFGDTSAAIKWRFREESARCPQAAISYTLNLPTASRRRGLGTGECDNALLASASKSFGRSSVAGDIGFTKVGSAEQRDNWQYGVLFTHQVSEPLTLGLELYGNSATAPGERDELAWGAGLIYNYDHDRSFLFRAGRSLHGFSDLTVYAGIQLDFK